MLHAAGIHTRIGMRRGKTLVRGNPLTDRLDMEGDSVHVAARLEPLAEQGEVLMTEELQSFYSKSLEYSDDAIDPY